MSFPAHACCQRLLELTFIPAGHVPLLADPSFCELAWSIGRASLGADHKQIWHLTKLYWYTVEVRGVEVILPCQVM